MDSKRLLVLDAKNLEHLWPDCHSLVVKPKAKAVLRFPFRRLEAIYMIGDHDRGLAGLLRASKAQIPTFFISARGDLKAYLCAPSNAAAELRGLLEWLRLHPCGDALLSEWLDNTWRHEMSLCGSRPDVGESPEVVESALEKEWEKLIGHEQWQLLLRHLNSWQRSRTLQVFLKLGLKPERMVSQWLLEKLRPCLASVVLLHLYLDPPDRLGEDVQFRYQWLAGLDSWMKERLTVWFTGLEMAIDEWRNPHG
ncbi:MAG: hypothetical protein IPM37_15750 [Hahellaceae bacterium]|nr:hypothetical protein [Hahellaceae bacterium]